ncbi:hypothetical protein HKD37_02G004718 [Glycine soja]
MTMAHAQLGPIDGSLLRLQHNHISNQVWEGEERMICPREASHYSWGTTILAFLFRVLGQAIKPLQTDIGGCLLLLQSGACDSIKCIVLWIDDLSDEEVQQELGFPLAQKWS